jgi:hypothetical protein
MDDHQIGIADEDPAGSISADNFPNRARDRQRDRIKPRLAMHRRADWQGSNCPRAPAPHRMPARDQLAQHAAQEMRIAMVPARSERVGEIDDLHAATLRPHLRDAGRARHGGAIRSTYRVARRCVHSSPCSSRVRVSSPISAFDHVGEAGVVIGATKVAAPPHSSRKVGMSAERAGIPRARLPARPDRTARIRPQKRTPDAPRGSRPCRLPLARPTREMLQPDHSAARAAQSGRRLEPDAQARAARSSVATFLASSHSRPAVKAKSCIAAAGRAIASVRPLCTDLRLLGQGIAHAAGRPEGAGRGDDSRSAARRPAAMRRHARQSPPAPARCPAHRLSHQVARQLCATAIDGAEKCSLGGERRLIKLDDVRAMRPASAAPVLARPASRLGRLRQPVERRLVSISVIGIAAAAR